MAMPNKMVVVGDEPTLGQIRDFTRQCVDGTLTRKMLQDIIEGKVKYPEEKPKLFYDLIYAIACAETQANVIFGYKEGIALFALPKPEEIPWKEIIAILLPPGIDNRQAVDSLQKYDLAKWEETDVNRYSGHEASDKPRLFLMERNQRPTKSTMGKSPDALVKTGRLWLPLKAYALAFGQYYESTKQYLDSETWTWFPTERLPMARWRAATGARTIAMAMAGSNGTARTAGTATWVRVRQLRFH